MFVDPQLDEVSIATPALFAEATLSWLAAQLKDTAKMQAAFITISMS